MPKFLKSGYFFTTAVTVSASSTYSTTTPELPCGNVDRIQIAGKVTGGNASASGLITIALQAKIHDVWCNDTWQSITVTMSGTDTITAPPEILDVKGLSSVRIKSITNADASYDGVVNVVYGANIG